MKNSEPNIMNEELKDMEIKPDERLWKNIEKKLPKKSNLGLKIASVSGGLVLVAAIILVLVAPNKRQEKNIAQNIEKNTNILTNNDVTNNNIVANNNNYDLAATNTSKVQNEITNKKESYNTTNSNFHIISCGGEIENNFKTNNATTNNNTILQNNNNTNNAPFPLIQKDTIKQQPKAQIATQNRKNPIIEDTINRLYLFIPNAFTPMENSNNIFKPAYCELRSYEITIYARNGKRVFRSNDINVGWDGKISGSYAPQGGYVYIIKFENLNGYSNTQKGTVTLIR
jgi:gliding motility-associated-like protein